MALKIIIVGVIILIIIIIALSMESVRNKFAFYPDNESQIAPEQLPNFVSEKQIQTTDGETLQALFFRHAADAHHRLIIYFHGNAGNLYDWYEYAQSLFEMGHDVLLVSYRGYSKSTGKPSEKGIYTDGESAVNYAIEKLGVDEKDITIFGRSLGTTVAIDISQNRDFNGVILITPLTSGKEMATAMGLGLLKFMASDSYNSIGKINNIKSKVLIIHGDRDELTPYAMGKKLAETFEGTKQMITIDGGGHNDLQDVNPVLFWGEIRNFLE